MIDLDELGRDLKAELTERITPGPPALDRVVRGARRRTRTRRLVAAAGALAIVAGGVGIAVGTRSHRSGVTIVTEPPATTSTSTTRPRTEHLTGDTWVLDLVRRSDTTWTTISGVVELQGATSSLRFAVSRDGPWYWQLDTLSGVYDGTRVTLDQHRHTLLVSTDVGRGTRGGPTNTDTVNELVSPSGILDASVEVNATSVHVVGSERVAGRDTWRTEIRFPSGSSLGPTWTWWIDKQTGIVLRSTVGGTKGFTSVAIDGPLPAFPDPIVAKGYAVDGVIAKRTVHEVVPANARLTTLLSQLTAAP
jgi:hypothetical protein